MSKLKYINGVNNAPRAIGPYSQAVIADNLVFVSGQVPIHPETGEIVDGGIEAQTDQVMKNLLAILGHMNIDFTHVMRTTIYLTDLSNFQLVNAIYAKWIGNVAPARATVQVSALPKGAQVEIDCIAVLTLPEQITIDHGAIESLSDLDESTYSASADCSKTVTRTKNC
jgi:2-iminobutanoate/2-iminopropanoate deaminase